MERTLVLIKPDAVQRALVGRIIQRFEDAGLKLIGIKILQPDRQHYHHHYENIGQMITRRGEEVFERALDLMMMGPVIAMALEGVEAVSLVRKLVGDTEPKSAQPGTIRGDFAHLSYGHADKHDVGVPNLVHASGDPTEAKAEIAHWFKDFELFDYQVGHERFTQMRKR